MRSKFSVNGETYFVSDHAFDRLFQRSAVRNQDEAEERILEAMRDGYTEKNMGTRRGIKGLPREVVVVHRDIKLHIRENTITTVTNNRAFLYSAA